MHKSRIAGAGVPSLSANHEIIFLFAAWDSALDGCSDQSATCNIIIPGERLCALISRIAVLIIEQ
jgi:hypothetical protein